MYVYCSLIYSGRETNLLELRRHVHITRIAANRTYSAMIYVSIELHQNFGGIEVTSLPEH